MDKKKSCLCNASDYIVLACSGSSDVGYLSDQVARKLSRYKVRKMNCLTKVATGTDAKIEEFRKCNILVIDGCNEDCGKKIMAMRGLDTFGYLRLTDLGYNKGKTSTSRETVNEIFSIAELI